jgi:hypothetical protein
MLRRSAATGLQQQQQQQAGQTCRRRLVLGTNMHLSCPGAYKQRHVYEWSSTALSAIKEVAIGAELAASWWAAAALQASQTAVTFTHQSRRRLPARETAEPLQQSTEVGINRTAEHGAAASVFRNSYRVTIMLLAGASSSRHPAASSTDYWFGDCMN